MHLINSAEILIDFRRDKRPLEEQSADVHRQANMHFFGNESGHVKDGHGSESGTFLGGNTLRVYHVQSIAKGIWIVAKYPLAPEQTRADAIRYIQDNQR